MNKKENKKIIFTLDAKCRDCYRCLKVCPVKAIRMKDEQAHVEEKLCIYCGTCIRECPQKAKMYRNDIEKVKEFLKIEGRFKALSLAPSFLSILSKSQIKKFVSTAKRIGFNYVAETSVGAYPVAKATYDYFIKQEKLVLSSSCPAFVNLIEKYYPEFVENLAPVVSPMHAHSRLIKEKNGDNSIIVFTGPCITKKEEAEKNIYNGLIDAVLTFEELFELVSDFKNNSEEYKENDFDETPLGFSRLFPIPGGLIKTGEFDDNVVNEQIIHISGIEEIKQLLDDKSIKNYKCLIEPLFCKGGCINGPAINKNANLLVKRTNLFKYNHLEKINNPIESEDYKNLKTRFSTSIVKMKKEYSEEEILSVLEKTGKREIENQLNCQACGYTSCREKAIAVLEGMAEPEMCIPYMRRLAEQRADKIIETSPNGIIILNKNLEIIKINSSFKELFKCENDIIGKNISVVIDPAGFEKLLSDDNDKIEITEIHKELNIICYEIFYKLKEESQFVGIFVDMTSLKFEHKKLEKIKRETIYQAKELMEHQIETAQRIAKFLGENVAISEKVVKNLLSLAEKDDE